MVKTNPYRLAKDIHGIGFFSADKVALSLGIAKDASERIGAAIEHVLQNAREEGHCYLTQEQLSEGVIELLSLENTTALDTTLQALEGKGELKIKFVPDEQGNMQKCFYAHSLYYDEQYIAAKVKQFISQNVNSNSQELLQHLEAYC